jgi:peptidyl-prolyl cis-trans isomerase A (cyclophilin A)
MSIFDQPLPNLEIITELGIIVVELEINKAPVTVANFLHHVKDGLYARSHFYRTVKPNNQPDNAVKIEVIQGGLGMNTLLEVKSPLPSIPLERTGFTGLQHKDGTLSMARLLPDSACSEFFICIGDQPELDYGGKRNPDGQGFAAFGQVVSGMEVVRQIQQSRAEGQNLTPPISIINIILSSPKKFSRE